MLNVHFNKTHILKSYDCIISVVASAYLACNSKTLHSIYLQWQYITLLSYNCDYTQWEAVLLQYRRAKYKKKMTSPPETYKAKMIFDYLWLFVRPFTRFEPIARHLIHLSGPWKQTFLIWDNYRCLTYVNLKQIIW